MATTTGQKRRKQHAGKRKIYAKFKNLSYTEKPRLGIQALFPGTELERVDLDLMVQEILRQAREDNLEVTKFLGLLLEHLDPWGKPTIEPVLERRLEALSSKLQTLYRGKHAGLLCLVAALLLHRMHSLREATRSAVERGDDALLRRVVEVILHGGDIDVLPTERFVVGT